MAALPGHSQMPLPAPAALEWGAKGVGCCCAASFKADGDRFILIALSPGLLQHQDGSVVSWGVQGCYGEQGRPRRAPMVPVGGGDGPQVNPTASGAENTNGMSTHFQLPSHGTCHPRAINSVNSLLAHFSAPFLHVLCMLLPHSLHAPCALTACILHTPCTVLVPSSHVSLTLLPHSLQTPCTILARSFHTSFPILTLTLRAAATLLSCPFHTPCSRSGGFARAPHQPTPRPCQAAVTV